MSKIIDLKSMKNIRAGVEVELARYCESAEEEFKKKNTLLEKLNVLALICNSDTLLFNRLDISEIKYTIFDNSKEIDFQRYYACVNIGDNDITEEYLRDKLRFVNYILGDKELEKARKLIASNTYVIFEVSVKAITLTSECTLLIAPRFERVIESNNVELNPNLYCNRIWNLSKEIQDEIYSNTWNYVSRIITNKEYSNFLDSLPVEALEEFDFELYRGIKVDHTSALLKGNIYKHKDTFESYSANRDVANYYAYHNMEDSKPFSIMLTTNKSLGVCIMNIVELFDKELASQCDDENEEYFVKSDNTVCERVVLNK